MYFFKLRGRGRTIVDITGKNKSNQSLHNLHAYRLDFPA